jgi:acetate kinase
MKQMNKCVLTINGGSSSIKFALYDVGNTLKQLAKGELENIGMKGTKLTFTDDSSSRKHTVNVKATDHTTAIEFLIGWLEKLDRFTSIKAIGHRIVFGMNHTDPEVLTPGLLKELKDISAFDPDHLPEEIKLIEVFKKHYAEMIQVACFDTSFHTTMPQVAKSIAIPRRFTDKGIQRYGFHGLSYAYLVEQLYLEEWNETSRDRVILAHLGSGASLAAVKNGKSVDTSMGFSPAAGIPMGTRTGDMDPGVAWYLMKNQKLTPTQFNHMVNHESGLLGISETSSDMRELLKSQKTDKRAAEAVELFCYETKKRIGSFAAVLGGLDTLVFSGGIGERSAEIRKRVCHGLNFLGIELDETKNLANETVISSGSSLVNVMVIPTNEELMIATSVCKILKYHIKH